MTAGNITHQHRRAPLLICAIILFFLACCDVALAEDRVIVGIEGLPETVSAGDEFVVGVVVDGVANLYGCDVQIVFDADILQAVDRYEAEEGVQVGFGDLLNPGFVVRNQVNNESGVMLLAYTQLRPTEPVTGSGSVAEITFQAVADGVPTAQFLGLTLASVDGDKIPASLGDWGTEQAIAAQVVPTATPAPTSAPTVPPEPTLSETEMAPPTDEPTNVPAATSTLELPTLAPTWTPAPTEAPTAAPTDAPKPTAPRPQPETPATSGWGLKIAVIALVVFGILMISVRAFRRR